jgi:long-chain fatty acid transport protein
MPRTSRLAVLLAAAAVPAAALANGFALDQQGVYSNATAGAGAADPRDPAAQFANPAALAALDGVRVTAGGMLVSPRAPYTDAGSTLAVGAPIPGANGDGAQDGQVPWVFASWRASPSLTLGLGLTTPFGLVTDFGQGSQFYGRYQGIESSVTSLELGPAIAWHVGGRLAVGAALAARHDHLVQSVAMDLGSQCVAARAAASDPDPAGSCASLGLVPGRSDGYGRFDGEGWSWATTLGATLEPVPGTTVGLAWRHEIRGTVRGHETFEIPQAGRDFLVSVGAPDALTGSGAGLNLVVPDFVTLHASHRLGAVTLLGALQWTGWSDLDALDLVADTPSSGKSISLVQDYRNAWRLAFGAAWQLRPALAVYGGAAYEQTPIQTASRQATLPEVDSILLAVGGEVALGAGFSLAAGWQHVEPTATARIDQLGTGGDRLVGSASTRADLVLAQLGWRR